MLMEIIYTRSGHERSNNLGVHYYAEDVSKDFVQEGRLFLLAKTGLLGMT